jgi:YHS domain-containing protein
MLVSIDTTSLVAVTLEMQSGVTKSPGSMTIKCGVTTGSVILLEGDDYIGHAVNVAARLCDVASAHEVLAVPSVIPQAPAWATVETADRVALRGLEQPIEVVRLGVHRRTRDSIVDPICQIPLTTTNAATRRNDGDGRELLFCSVACAETWEQRRVPVDPDAGSIRELWMR